eukprot:SAG31_NODE_656_length_13120_cov_10.091237_4_plen_317_part_00
MDAGELARSRALRFRHGGNNCQSRTRGLARSAAGASTVRCGGVHDEHGIERKRSNGNSRDRRRRRRNRNKKGPPKQCSGGAPISDSSQNAAVLLLARQSQNMFLTLLSDLDIRLMITADLGLPTLCRSRRVCRNLQCWVDADLTRIPQPTAIGGFSMVASGHGLGKYLANCETLQLGNGMRWRSRQAPGQHLQVRRADFAVAPIGEGFEYLVVGGFNVAKKTPIPWAERLSLRSRGTHGGNSASNAAGAESTNISSSCPNAVGKAISKSTGETKLIPLGPNEFRAGGCVAVGKGLLSRFCANYQRNTVLLSRDVTH